MPTQNIIDLLLHLKKLKICELGVIGGLITLSRSWMLSFSLPVYQVMLDWLPLPSCIASNVVIPNN